MLRARCAAQAHAKIPAGAVTPTFTFRPMPWLGYICAMSTLPLTSTLNLALSGDTAAAERAWTEVYAEVRAIAAAAVLRERGGAGAEGDLHPTGLVHEIFLRIGRHPPRAWDSRRHFFGAVAQACEQVLVDLARTRNALKRGGGRPPVPLTFEAGELADRTHARAAAEVARLRYMLGLPNADVARILGVSESTVEKDWAFARAWLRRELDREAGDASQ